MATLVASILTIAITAAGPVSASSASASKENRLYELRIYTAAEGKLDALHTRFRDHTMKLFEKHGMTNVGYWIPIDNASHKLIYVLSYPDPAARETSWKAFQADPAWQKVKQASEENGKLVTKVEKHFLFTTDFSPIVKLDPSKKDRVYELRTYTCTPGNLKALHTRFRNHTKTLFAKHGMTNLWYWIPVEDKNVSGTTLIYMLVHDSRKARDDSFAAFRADPDWKKVLMDSETKAGGPLTEKNGVDSILMTGTDYSPLR